MCDLLDVRGCSYYHYVKYLKAVAEWFDMRCSTYEDELSSKSVGDNLSYGKDAGVNFRSRAILAIYLIGYYTLKKTQ